MSAPHEIISDEEIMRVHGHANFGDMSPREVVNDGVRKYAIGYTGGHTQLCILMEHGLITTPKPGKYSANLTKKGKRYAQAISVAQQAVIEKARAVDADLIYSAWLGLRVLENIAKVKNLSGAADVTTPLLSEIEAAHPEFAPRSALRAALAEGTPT